MIVLTVIKSEVQELRGSNERRTKPLPLLQELRVESHAMEDYTAVSASRTKKEQVALAGAEVTERKMVDERVE